MGCAAPDIVEHCSFFAQSAVDEGIISGKVKGVIRDCVAVCDHAGITACIPQHLLVVFTRTGHDRATL